MKYIIITPAFNEGKNIDKTIESVLIQTIKPLLWVIVDDDSTDNTAQIIKKYAGSYAWIKYVKREKEPCQTYFASNVFAIQKGMEYVTDFDYDYLAILDADITLTPDYYQKIANVFNDNKNLGIASGNCADKIGDKVVKHIYDRRSCAKAVMVFRKECYKDIGGFVPLKYGGEDTCACFTARMKGWKTWAFHELLVIHNKPLGMGSSKNILLYRFRQGIGEYFVASHPVFLILKSVKRMLKERPYFAGSVLRIAGFCFAYLKHEKRQISKELISYIQKEQLKRIFSFNGIPEEFRVNYSKS